MPPNLWQKSEKSVKMALTRDDFGNSKPIFVVFLAGNYQKISKIFKFSEKKILTLTGKVLSQKLFIQYSDILVSILRRGFLRVKENDVQNPQKSLLMFKIEKNIFISIN